MATDHLVTRDGGHPCPEGIWLWERDTWTPGTMSEKGVRGSMQRSWVTAGLLPQPRTHPRRPSMAAAPPGMILVMKIPGSSGTWGLSMPPAMLKPRPELPCGKSNATSFPHGQLLVASPPYTVTPSRGTAWGSGALRASITPRGARLRGQRDAGRRRGWRSSAECSAQQRGALNRWSGRVGAAEDLPQHRVSTERLRQAGSWGKRRWSLAEKASPRWLLPRRRHRCRSLHRPAGIVPVSSIPLLPPCTLGCSPGTEPSWGPATLMPTFTSLGGGGYQDGVGPPVLSPFPYRHAWTNAGASPAELYA